MFGIGMGLFVFGAVLLFILGVVVIILKGYSLWYAAKRDEKGWFIALLIVNTMGILELIYLIFIVKKWSKKDVQTPQTPPPATPVPPSAQ
jgi:methionyl-tRNA synthetase